VLESTGKRGAEVPTAVTTDTSFYRPGYNAVEAGESQVTFRRTPSPHLRAYENARQETSGALLAVCFVLVFHLPSSTLKVEATCYAETQDDTIRTAWRYTSEARTFHSHHCQTLKCWPHGLWTVSLTCRQPLPFPFPFP
jgi:hypothetical protein